MHPFIKQILSGIDVHATHGATTTLDDFSEGDLQDRYAKLFEKPGHYVYVLDTSFKSTRVKNWAEFMNVVNNLRSDIDSVVAVPMALAEQVETALDAAA